MIYVIAALVILGLIFAPQYWVQWVLDRHNKKTEENFPGTGGEFARHLLDRYHLEEIKVGISDMGDHYNPGDRSVNLTRDKFEGRTLTAITVSAHECGHALQHAAGERLFMVRTRLAKLAVWAQRLGSFLLFAAPLLVLFTRAPSVALLNITGAVLVLGFAIIMHIITLPVEIDASFNKALPILESGYLNPEQLPAARSILRAAAWTYVAASLASLFNFWRWMAVLRR